MTTAKLLPKKPKAPWPKVRKVTHKNGKEAWMVDARIKGKGERLHFETKIEAQTVAEQCRIRRKNQGDSAFTMPQAERVDAEVALDLLRPQNATLLEAAKFYLKHTKIIRKHATLAEAGQEFVASLKADGVSKYTFWSWQSFMRRFAREFPGAMLTDFTTRGLDDWLRGLPVATRSRNSYRDLLCRFFYFAVERDYLMENPVTKIKRLKLADKAPGVLTVEECARLLEACNERFLPSVALGLFAGLRPYSEVVTLEWRHIHFEERFIDIEATKTKTARRRFVTIQPNLLEWLLPCKGEKGKVAFSTSVYWWQMKLARQNAGIANWPADVLRHSFASYHYAHFKNASDTAHEMGHTGTNKLFQHYRARVTAHEAAAFWNIRPAVESKVVPMVA